MLVGRDWAGQVLLFYVLEFDLFPVDSVSQADSHVEPDAFQSSAGLERRVAEKPRQFQLGGVCSLEVEVVAPLQLKGHLARLRDARDYLFGLALWNRVGEGGRVRVLDVVLAGEFRRLGLVVQQSDLHVTCVQFRELVVALELDLNLVLKDAVVYHLPHFFEREPDDLRRRGEARGSVRLQPRELFLDLLAALHAVRDGFLCVAALHGRLGAGLDRLRLLNPVLVVVPLRVEPVSARLNLCGCQLHSAHLLRRRSASPYPKTVSGQRGSTSWCSW